ncbi:MAG: ferrous iron transport protein B [Proteobacteria bacterium]|nr:ferrous iron transport protein B [Pseudomonadota bacterium]
MHNKIKVLLVGNPNVGKSALFNALTGKYVAVSNYPGTTVEFTQGEVQYKGNSIEIIDTPGMYSMLPISEEEKVARNLILQGNPDWIVNVVDAKNLERMLPLTFQLIETGIPVILVLNMMDEAKRMGLEIDCEKLSQILGLPVIKTVSIKKIGVKDILNLIINAPYTYKPNSIKYDNEIEQEIEKLINFIKGDYKISKRLLSILLLQKDEEISDLVKVNENEDIIDVANTSRRKLEEVFRVSLDYMIALKRQLVAGEIVQKIFKKVAKEKESKVVSFISAITIHRIWGYPILFLVLYFGLYKFVGQFGAGTLVDFIETNIFEEWLLSGLTNLIEEGIKNDNIKELLIRDYGVITLGLKYAIAIILPIVTTFFLFFSILEDSGYLPRLAFLLDRVFKKIGLTGKAVIPLVLGFGCDTMATMVTRTLNTKKERVIATILLSLAVPCSAQLGVMLAVLSTSSTLLAIWVFILVLIFFIVGYFSKYFIRGEKTIFFVEIPPVRIPKLSNIIIKTYTRLVWYFKEVLPLFIYASLLIWVGRITGIFDLLLKIIAYPLQFIGLPYESAKVFLFGFFRRDYGAAGLYDLHKQGVFNNNQLLILSVMLTLFLPCIAQFIMTVKERGLKMGISIALFVTVFSILTGYLLHLIINVFLGISL